MSKGKTLLKRGLSLLLSAAMVLSCQLSYDGITAKAADAEDGLILYYDFDLQNSFSTSITDASGHQNAGELVRDGGSVEGTYSIDEANIYGKTVKALRLPGGDDGPYLLMPEGILNGNDAVTISTWVKLPTDAGYQRIWDFGNDSSSYMYLLSDGFNDGHMGYASAITLSGYLDEKGPQMTDNFARNRWVLTTVVMDGTKMSLYLDGEQIGETVDTGISVSDLGDTANNYIGKGQFSEPPTNGWFAEFKIYNRALSPDEIAGMYYVDDAGIVSSDKADLDLGDLSSVTSDFALPSKGVSGSDITWESANPAIAIEDGVAKVTRPAQGEANATGKLTATIKYGTASDTKEFDVTVLAEYSDLQIAEHDAQAAVEALGDLSAVMTDITLPVSEWGSDITWESTNPAVVIEDGVAKVTRPAQGEANATGKLILTATRGEESVTKEIDITVIALRESVKIDKIEEINVATLLGHSPSLPNYVKVTYSDGTIGKLKAMWPEFIEEEQYNKEGTFEVAGSIVGETDETGASIGLTATVTVADGESVAKSVVSDSFDLSDISLDSIGEEGSILTQNRDRDLAYLKLLDNKRMLYNFYKTFGETDKIEDVQPLGGWDEPGGLLRGHSTGHYMSALALAYASTGDEEIKAKLDEMISEMHRLQQKSKGNAADFKTNGVLVSGWSTNPEEWGEGFISAYSPDQFALLEQYTPYGSPDSGIWAPYYTMHKLLSGFLDAYTYTGNQEALEVAKGLGKWAYERLSVLPQEQLTKMWDMYIAGELGGMNEVMAQLYIYTGDEIYLKGAKLFDNTTFFNNLEKNVDDIRTRHANQHIPQIIGALKEYEATVAAGSPEPKYYDIAENFWQMVVSRYAYSMGGMGTGEKFTEPYQQANNISGDTNCETCCVYNMLKLTKMLNNYDPDNAEYMDYYERALYNQILASQTPDVTSSRHNGTTYMLPIGPGTRRGYSDDYQSFTCCHGTGMENHVKYQEAAYAKTDDTLYVGLYLPSTLTWDEKGVQVVQETVFPSEDTKLTVKAIDGKEAQSFNIKLRVPYWATNGFNVKLNGEDVELNAEISTYVELTGIKAGDVIDINMPWTLHLDKTPDKIGSSMIASVMYGPFVMAAQNDSTEWQRLVVPQTMEDVTKIGVNEENGFPTLSLGGFEFAPMFAPEFAREAYHTYFKVLVTNDDGSKWYEVHVTNLTERNGTITTSANAEMVKEGDDLVITLSPNEGYVTKKLIVNGDEVTPDGNEYIVKNVTGDVDIVVAFRPPVLDPKDLEFSADLTSSMSDEYYGHMLDIMDDWEPTTSDNYQAGGRGWSNWYVGPGAECFVQYTWDEPVTMDAFDVYWKVAYYESDREHWMRVPASVKVMYLDSDGSTWKEANMLSAYDDIVNIDQYNTIRFDPITTSAVRLSMVTQSDEEVGCTGILRWKVMNEGGAEPTEAPTAEPAEESIDISGTVPIYGEGDVSYDETTGTVTGENVQGLMVPLGKTYNPGDVIEIAVYGEANAPARAWLSTMAGTDEFSAQFNPMAWDTANQYTATGSADAIQVKKATYDADNFTSIKITKVTVKLISSGPEPTEAPTAAPTKEPTAAPTEEPTAAPTEEPTAAPTEEPAAPTEAPSAGSTSQPQASTPPAGVPEAVKVSSIEFASKLYRIAAGKKVDLGEEVTVNPDDAANKVLAWSVSDGNYASVDQNGLVTVNKAGIGKKVTVTAASTDGSNITASVQIKIMKNAVKKVTINGKKKASKTLKAGKKFNAKAKVKIKGKKKLTNSKLKWVSSNPKWAKVSKKGKITALKAGAGKTVTITAYATDGSNKKAVIKIKIKK